MHTDTDMHSCDGLKAVSRNQVCAKFKCDQTYVGKPTKLSHRVFREILILNIQLLETSQSLYRAEVILYSINTLIH